MKIAIIGVGAMGGAVAEGLLKSKSIAPADLTLSNPHIEKLTHFAEQEVNVGNNNIKAVDNNDVVIVAVKPWLVEKVLKEIKPVMNYARQRLVVVAAGVSAVQICDWMEKDSTMPASFIVIPNTAAAVCSSTTFIVSVSGMQDDTTQIEKLFQNIGDTFVVEERQLSAGMALASCGIAYAMRYIRAASEGGVELGFKAAEAQRIVSKTVMGAAALLMEGGSHAEVEIDKVATPGGLTIKGLNAMERNGFSNAVIEGLKAGV